MNLEGEMRWFFGDDHAILRFSESGHAFSVDIVMVPPSQRGQGIGGKLVGHVLDMADAMNKEVNVAVRPIGVNTPERLQSLVGFYGRMGFSVIDTAGSIVYMKRKPSRSEGDPSDSAD